MLDAALVQALPPGHYLAWLGAALVVGGVGTLAFFRNLGRARVIEDTPTSRIRSAAQGYVELVGRCQPIVQPPLSAPLTGEACVWHRYEVARFERSGNGGRWRRIESGGSTQPFELDDGTGRCRVDPAGAEIIPAVRDVWYGNSPRPPQRSRSAALMLGARYRYTEERLHVGDPVYVLGHFSTERVDPAQRVRERLRQWKRDRRRLLAVFDVNRDGEIDQHEWERVREHVEREVAAEPLPPPLNRIGKPSSGRLPYLIACRDQRELAARYRRRSALSLLAAVPSTSFGLWLLYARFLAG